MEAIQTFLSFALGLVFTLGLLITLHEMGHFGMARYFGIKILRFSVGFGKPFYIRRLGKDQTEFCLAYFPLGGYVKMLDEREGEVAADDLDRAFNRRPLFQRTMVVLAGPMCNLIIAIFAYWLVFLIGIQGFKPIVGHVETASIAEYAGFQNQDQIIAVDQQDVATWSSVIDILVEAIIKGERLHFTLLAEGGTVRDVELDLARISTNDIATGDVLSILGLDRYRPVLPAVIDKIVADGVAAKSGLQAGDKVIEVDGQAIMSWQEWVAIIQSNPQQTLSMVVERKQQNIWLDITPATKPDQSGKVIGYIGVMVAQPLELYAPLLASESYPLFPALRKATEETWQKSVLTLRILGKMLTGEVSIKNISGPITIAEYAGRSVQLGVISFLQFLALVSINLGVLNLLPIPLLDGGHLFYYLIEFISRRQVSESFQAIGQRIGLLLLAGIMWFAIYNDIMRLL